MENIRVVIVDDDKLVRRSLGVFLNTAADIEIVGEAADGIEGIEVVRRTRPDVVLLDMQMPRMGGIEAASIILSEMHATRVLAITTFGTTDVVLPMLRAGASGYLLKDAEPEEIIDAVRLISSGSSILSPAVTARLIETVQAGTIAEPVELPPQEQLSERESNVLQQLALGSSNGEIARALHVSESTVKTHLSSVMLKWNVRDRVQILIHAARAGLVNFR